MTEASEKTSYKKTLNLPKTSFPMKANLVQNEPASLKRWDSMGLYQRLRDARAGKPMFVFHDGPPYANGSLHLGHLLNKTLKDFVVRSRGMAGRNCPYVPGWDCHGLPIEHRVVTELHEKGKAQKLESLEPEQAKLAIRRECKNHAEKYVKLQAGQLHRLLTLGDEADPYLTMNPGYEAEVLEVLATLVERGLVYRALRPVHWSVANETALADAELEYLDREDVSVYVDFEAADAGAVYEAFGLDEESRPAVTPSFMIWTTTPWTLPANLAIAVSKRFRYALVRMDGAVTIIAEKLLNKVAEKAQAEQVEVLALAEGDKLLGLRYTHPFVENPAGDAGNLLTTCWTIVDADYVTLEDGTGLVHTAPGHGTEDYQTGQRVGLPVYCPVRADGTYDETVPEWIAATSIWTANDEITERLRHSGHLVHDERFMHSYPHDWRGKTPVIFRCTEQWFVSVDRPCRVDGDPEGPEFSLRQRALGAVDASPLGEMGGPLETAPGDVDNVEGDAPDMRRARPAKGAGEFGGAGAPSGPIGRGGRDDISAEPVGVDEDRARAKLSQSVGRRVEFIPEWSRNRFRAMVENRPDWCISRQRAWGLPIPAFELPDGTMLMTPASVRAVAELIRREGSDAWFTKTPADLLQGYDAAGDPDAPDAVRTGSVKPDQLTKGGDILDVWFESGSSWKAVMEQRLGDAGLPIELYLEGSDQHRGWFQLSMLTALGVRGRPPYRTVLTHGFMVDKEGKKLSKSAGHTLEDLFERYGADVIRWWVCSLSHEGEMKVDDEFFRLAGESYRKVRNTLRFMLSNLSDFDPAAHRVDRGAIEPTSLDAWAMETFERLAAKVTESFERYDFRRAHAALYEFCANDMSSVYLAAVKDRLYCDPPHSPRRRATQTALYDLADGLCRLLAPVLCHTADEAFRAMPGRGEDACVHLEEYTRALGVAASAAWPAVMTTRDEALKALETAKTERGLDNALDAGLVLPDPNGVLAGFNLTDLADVMGVSRVRLDASAQGVIVEDLSAEPRCERSWKRDGTVKQRADGGMLSDRDADAVGVA